MVFKKSQPNEVEKRAAQRKELEAERGEERREQAGALVARAARERTHGAWDAARSDHRTPPEETERLRLLSVAAEDDDATAAAALAAGRTRRGDLAAREKLLSLEEHFSEQADVTGADLTDEAEEVRMSSGIAAILARRKQRRQDALVRQPEVEVLPDGRVIQKGYGLVDTDFPEGIFDAVATPVGVRSVWLDHVVEGIARLHPDVLVAALGEQGSAIVAKVQADVAAKKPRRYARGIGWEFHPTRRGA
jgi:hypothetical protein